MKSEYNASKMILDKKISLLNNFLLIRCFEEFKLVHSLTTSPVAIYTAACDVIQEFFEDNVIYLELRSTPRAVEGYMTKEEYVEAVISAIK